MHTDDFTELVPEKDAMSEGLKCYFKDFQGEYRELSHVSEVNLTPLMECTTKFTTELERIFGKKDYVAERKYWIKRYKKIDRKV